MNTEPHIGGTPSLQGPAVPAEWTGRESQRPYPATRLDQLLERQAARTPNAPAVCEGSTTLTYAGLMQQAWHLARQLRRQGLRRDDLVALCVNRSIEQLVAIVAILRAGAAYVPINPRAPVGRFRFMLEDARPRAIIINASTEQSIPSEFREIAIRIDTLTHGAEAGDDDPIPMVGMPQDLAYVMYTSGSTGTPKGVLNQHDGVVNHLMWMAEEFPLSTDDRVLAKTPAEFDVSVWESFWPLSQGACLVLARQDGEKDVRYLLDVIRSHRITDIHFVPTLLRVFLECQGLERCQSLRRVICSGEPLTAELRDRFFERLPGPPALINLYGPTETAVHVTSWVCRPDDVGPVPIGRPLSNVRAYIVDENLGLVPEGIQGELLIGGVQVARGYLRRPELTSERFVPDPFSDDPTARCYHTGDRVSWRADGVIDFFGRDDSQVQLGGIRVELGEIESRLRLHPAVSDAAVVVEQTATSKRLVAYLRRSNAAHAGPDPTIESLRRQLANTLTNFMIPSAYVWLDEFPLTATGKIDRHALPTLAGSQLTSEKAFEPARAGTEARMARLWIDELRLDRVGRHDDFHLLGGDSLGALQVCESIMTEFGIEMSPSELLRSPTIALLASRIDAGNSHASRSTSIVPLNAGQGRQALYLPPGMGGDLAYWRAFIKGVGSARPVYGFTLPAHCEAQGELQALAATFVKDLVAFQPEGPYHLAGYSFSGALALEMAQQLRASGRIVGILAMIDYGPGPPDSWAERARTVGYFIENLPYWLIDDILPAGWRAVGARLQRKMSTLWDRILHIGRVSSAKTSQWAADEMFGHLHLPKAHRRLIVDHLDAYHRYRPAVYGGRVLLFRARCRPLGHSLAPALGWEHYAAGFERIVIACNHDNILMPPYAGSIAAALEQVLMEQESIGPSSYDRMIGRPVSHHIANVEAQLDRPNL